MSDRQRPRHARLMCGAALVALALATGAHAQSPGGINIAPQSLDTALNELGTQSNHQVMIRADIAAGKTTHGVTNAPTFEAALLAMLDGTGLTWRRQGDTYLIVGASDPQSGSAAGDGADQGTVQALVVTAQKREENIQDVPIAMSAFSQEDLTRSQVAGGPDLMTQVPNFTFTKTNFSGYSIQIRGIGTQAISATTDPAVAVAFNNTPFIRNRFFEQEFYDLERVEVLRGPQGTLYGRNATAGVVNIISAKPANHFEAKLSADVGNYNSTRLEGMINLPLVEDKAALRIAGAWTKRDGFVKNTLSGQQTDGRDLWSTRVTLGLTPTDNFKANLIWEHFSENDDRLRSGKQLCNKDLGPETVGGIPVRQYDNGGAFTVQFSQGCKPASLYSPDSYQTPNGFALPYFGPLTYFQVPINAYLDPYASATQSSNLREIETHITPQYQAKNDTLELQLQLDLPHNLTFASETGFNHDSIFSFEDYNRFDTTPGVFFPNASSGMYLITDANGVFCDPQIGCTNRLAAGDLSTAKSRQFSQEFRLSSNFSGPVNFNLGANFLRYDTEDKYYVFINTLTMAAVAGRAPWVPGVTSDVCLHPPYDLATLPAFAWANPNKGYPVIHADGLSCDYIDPNNIHNLNDEGRNYFLSKNPYHLLSYAAFGEVYYNITDQLKLTAGLRWTVDKKTAPQIPSWLLAQDTYGLPTRKVINQEWREPTGRLALDWKPQLSFTDETLVYGSYVRGYKAGGANPPRPIVTFQESTFTSYQVDTSVAEAGLAAESVSHPETFKPEFVNAYEIGTKNTLLDGRLTFNLNSFYYDYTGYQISEIVDRSALNLNFDAKIWGAELETDWRPLENLRLGLKVGYEDTRLAKGSRAVDLMDRTAGNPNYVLERPFPSSPSNCIVPVWLATWNGHIMPYLCQSYLLGVDPATGLPYTPNPTLSDFAQNTQGYGSNYPGFDPNSVPNNGEGIAKDLSGNSLPNAPHITATLTADYTLPLPNDWLLTLHSDLYYQSEAWTRIFNDPGYDKLKAYNNVNLAAIFANEDRGWQVMAYVKNVFNKDNITGAFLNSDDTGLTTNVFLNEPRLYGLRVTKNWSGSEWWSAHANHSGWYPYRVELEGDYGPFGHKHELLVTDGMKLSTYGFVYPMQPQKDLDWGGDGGVKLTYQPDPQSWMVSAHIRYGAARGEQVQHSQTPIGNQQCLINGALCADWSANYNVYNFSDQTTKNSESHTLVDFMIGKDVGLGSLGGRNITSNLSVGVSYAQFKSDSSGLLRGRPDFYAPANAVVSDSSGFHKYQTHFDEFAADFTANREFTGAGPSFEWQGALPLLGNADRTGRVDLDVGLGGGVLFGKQKTQMKGQVTGDHSYGVSTPTKYQNYAASLDTAPRSKSVNVPVVRANLGLVYTVGGLKLSGGWRSERYYKVFDAGIENRKTYDRSFDGVYAKVSIGFGG